MKPSVQIGYPLTPEQRQAFERYRLYEGSEPKSDYRGTGGRFYLWFDSVIKIVRKAFGR